MAQWWFYHVENSPLDHVVCDLAAKCLDNHWRVTIASSSDDRLKSLDDALWQHNDQTFLPHGLSTDSNASRQPILLTTKASGEALEGRHAAILLDGTGLTEDDMLERVIVIANAHDEASLIIAREQWKEAKAKKSGRFFKQQNGRWIEQKNV